MRSFAVRLSIFFALIFVAVSGFAQVGTQARVDGFVTDATGAAIPNAHVVLTNTDTGQHLQAETKEDGSYHLLAVPPGSYRAEVSAVSFKTWVQARVSLTVGDQINLSPILENGSASETIEVKSNNTALETDNTAVQTVIQMEQIRELPLDNRDPIQLMSLTPGVIYEGQNVNRVSFVRYLGMRNVKSSFQLDGVVTNDGLNGGATAIPNVDAIQEMNVQVMNAGAEAGRDPMQVLLQTRFGTNKFHGSAYEYFQNDYLNAWPTFSKAPGQVKPRVRYNLFGGTLGGPIFRDKTFFFLSFQETAKRNAQTYNVFAIPQAWATGDFTGTTVYDPVTNAPFPGSQIPQSRWSNASKYFLPLILKANVAPNRYINSVAFNDITYEGVVRVDHQITPKQRIYVRHLDLDEPTEVPGYSADKSLFGFSTVAQHNTAVTYTYTLNASTLLTITGGYMRNRQYYNNPNLGKQNDAEIAGIQGIPTAGRERWIGPPNINISGYTGVSFAGGFGVPGELKSSVYTEKVALDMVRGRHSLSFGGEAGDRHVFGGHGSSAPRGAFAFTGSTAANGLTHNAFADYLLGYTTAANLNDALPQFGQSSAKSFGAYAKDIWKILPNLTLNVALRYDHFFSVSCYKHLCDGWDKNLKKVVVDNDENGNPNFTTLASSAALAADMDGLWITAKDAGYKHGLFNPTNNFSPRLGLTFRPNNAIVFRAAYGAYYNIYTGNRGASMINAPTFGNYSKSFAPAAKQRWETVWASDGHITSGYAINTPLVNNSLVLTRQWNFSTQTALPRNISLTLSYVGAKVPNEITSVGNNLAPVGYHVNINADQPLPRFGAINTYENVGQYWAHAMNLYAERRYKNGLAFTFAYAWGKTMESNTGETETDQPLSYSPYWYNRHEGVNSYRHIQSSTLVFDFPYGHGHHFGANANALLQGIAGGWLVSFIQTAHSGQPLVISQSNLNLGNNQSSRANRKIGRDPNAIEKTREHWFDKTAFEIVRPYNSNETSATACVPPATLPANTSLCPGFGTSNVGDVRGPGFVRFDVNISKTFHIYEHVNLQIRGQAFNFLNHVNMGNPGTNINAASFGIISSAQTNRYMQLAAKLTF